MPRRRTFTISRSTKLFGTRFTTRYTHTRPMGGNQRGNQPNVQVHLTGRDLLEMQQREDEAQRRDEQARQEMNAVHATRVAQLREQETARIAQHLRTLHGAAAWLHTYTGVAIMLAITLIWLAASIAANSPLFFFVYLALLLLDRPNAWTLHGRIQWPVLKEASPTKYYALLFSMIAYGWIFAPFVYLWQAWQLVPQIRVWRWEQLQSAIRQSEQDLGLRGNQAAPGGEEHK